MNKNMSPRFVSADPRGTAGQGECVARSARQLELAIAGGDKNVAGEALRRAQPELMRGVTKGVVHRNVAARKMSRLSARIKSM